MRPRISLICHASTRALRAATFGGDDALDDAGHAAAGRLAARLPAAERCYTSPALRARQTAAAMGLEAVEAPALRDCDFGRWEGQGFRQVLLKEPRRLVSWVRRPEGAPHGGETIAQVLDRVAAWMREPARNAGHTVGVTHAAVVRAAVVHVIGAGLASFWRIDVAPLTLADFRTNGRRWVLRSVGPIVAGDDDG